MGSSRPICRENALIGSWASCTSPSVNKRRSVLATCVVSNYTHVSFTCHCIICNTSPKINKRRNVLATCVVSNHTRVRGMCHCIICTEKYTSTPAKNKQTTWCVCHLCQIMYVCLYVYVCMSKLQLNEAKYMYTYLLVCIHTYICHLCQITLRWDLRATA